MNIWIVSDGEPLPIDRPKVRLRRMGMLSKILVDRGHEVHWFSSAFHHYKKIHRSEKDLLIDVEDNLTIHLIKTEGYQKNISIDRIKHHKKLAEKFREQSLENKKPDLILATMAPLELSREVVEYGKRHKIPTVIDIRDLWPKIFNEVVPSWAKLLIQPYIKVNEKKLSNVLKEATAIVAVTPKFLDYGLNVAKMEKRKFDHVFHTAYSPRDLSKQERNFKDDWEKYGLKKDDFIVTFMGNFGKQFVLEPLIEAAEKLQKYPDIKFVMCGVGETFEGVKLKTKPLNNIILPGWIEEKEIISLLSNTDLGVAPYRNSANFRDNAPNKFGEYLSASLPVLISVHGIMEELSTKYNCGLVYRNSEELSLQIEELFNNKDKFNEMSNNAYRLFEEKFNSRNVYVEFAKHLESVIKNKS